MENGGKGMVGDENVNYRNKALTRSAKSEACVACGAEDGTVVWAHSNEQEHGKGLGIKAHDLLGNYLCLECHRFYDLWGGFSGAERRTWFREQYPKTMVRLCEKLARGELKL